MLVSVIRTVCIKLHHCTLGIQRAGLRGVLASNLVQTWQVAGSYPAFLSQAASPLRQGAHSCCPCQFWQLRQKALPPPLQLCLPWSQQGPGPLLRQGQGQAWVGPYGQEPLHCLCHASCQAVPARFTYSNSTFEIDMTITMYIMIMVPFVVMIFVTTIAVAADVIIRSTCLLGPGTQ